MTDVLLRKKKILNIVGAFVAAGAVLFYGTVPVFASSQSVGTIDSDSISMTDMAAQVSTLTSQYVPDGATELRMPVYLNFNRTALWENYTYISGYLLYGATPNSFGIYTGGSAQVTRAYFEPSNDRSISAVWLEGNSLRVYFDNARITGYSNSSAYVLIGYMVYKFDPAPTGFTYITPTSSTVNITPNGYVRGTAYEYGFAEAIAYGISQSSSMVEVNEWLANISQDTSYLPTIVSILQTNFPLILNALSTINNNVYAIYQQLLSMNAAQSSEAAAIEGEVNQKASQSAVLSDDMAVNKPQLSGDDINITGLIDSSVNQKFTGFLGALVNNQFITTMFLIALSCMIIGFVLYGKK